MSTKSYIEKQQYHPLLKLIHWLMALCIIGMIAVGWYMEGLNGKTDPLKWDLYGWHKSFGVLLLLLVVLRIFLRIKTKIPKIPETLKKIEIKMAHAAHFLLYGFMIAIPLSGYIMSDAGGYGVKFFGIVMPDFFEKNKVLGGFAHEIHEIAPYILLGIIVLHVVGALKHRFMDGAESDVLGRMLPNCKECMFTGKSLASTEVLEDKITEKEQKNEDN